MRGTKARKLRKLAEKHHPEVNGRRNFYRWLKRSARKSNA